MDKRILAACLSAAAALALAVLVRGARAPSSTEGAPQPLARIEGALDDTWVRQMVTVVSPTVYVDAAGNTLVYHLCRGGPRGDHRAQPVRGAKRPGPGHGRQQPRVQRKRAGRAALRKGRPPLPVLDALAAGDLRAGVQPGRRVGGGHPADGGKRPRGLTQKTGLPGLSRAA